VTIIQFGVSTILIKIQTDMLIYKNMNNLFNKKDFSYFFMSLSLLRRLSILEKFGIKNKEDKDDTTEGQISLLEEYIKRAINRGIEEDLMKEVIKERKLQYDS